MQNKLPIISIITVCFNAEKTIKDTIESIINQTYPHFEYIIIDGKSTDNTVNIIKSYNSKITTWISEPDEGIYDAMNKGINIAKGQFINFINAGDIFHNNSVLNTISAYLEKSDIIYGKYLKIWKNRITVITPPRKINRFTLLVYFGINHQTIFARKELLFGFDCNYKIAADYNWLLTAYQKNNIKFTYIDSLLINYDPYGISSFHDTNTEFLSILKTHYGLIIYNYYKIKWEIFKHLKVLKRLILNYESRKISTSNKP